MQSRALRSISFSALALLTAGSGCSAPPPNHAGLLIYTSYQKGGEFFPNDGSPSYIVIVDEKQDTEIRQRLPEGESPPPYPGRLLCIAFDSETRDVHWDQGLEQHPAITKIRRLASFDEANAKPICRGRTLERFEGTLRYGFEFQIIKLRSPAAYVQDPETAPPWFSMSTGARNALSAAMPYDPSGTCVVVTGLRGTLGHYGHLGHFKTLIYATQFIGRCPRSD